jgi:thymidylate synthase (FAD)
MNVLDQSVILLGMSVPIPLIMGNPLAYYQEQIPERLIELAGRVCYKSEGKITENSYINFVDKVCNQLGHESVMEHGCATLKIVCDRGISHELVRHRITSVNQESTRYCDYSKGKHEGITVIEPPGIRCDKQHEYAAEVEECKQCLIYNAWKYAVTVADTSYLNLRKLGVSPQIARSVLPTCLKTEVVMTANFREWKHIIELRGSPAAHPQAVEIANMVQSILHKIAPTLFKVTSG